MDYNDENLFLPPQEAYEKVLAHVEQGKMSVRTWHDKTTGQFCLMPRIYENVCRQEESMPLYDTFLAALPVFIEKFSMEHQEVDDDDFAAALQRAARGETCEQSKKTTNTRSTASPGRERQHTLQSA